MTALTTQKNLMGLGMDAGLAQLLSLGTMNNVQAPMTVGADQINGANGTGTNGAGTNVAVTGGTSNGTGAGTSVILTPGTVSTGAAGGVFNRGAVYVKQGTPTAKTVAVTLTAAELLTGIITAHQGGGAAANYQLPLASALQTAMATDLANDDAFDFYVINLSTVAAEDITITTNTNWTLVGGMTIEARDSTAANASAHFRARRTAANTFTLYRLA